MKRVGMAALLLLVTAGASLAQTYPSRTIRLISPNPPGGANDTISRAMATKMSGLLGQQIIIDNRGGAGGLIGGELAAHAAPDGYTLLTGSVSTHSFAPIMHAKLAYDPIKDFAPVSLFAVVQNVLVVSPSLPAKTVQELVARQEIPGRAEIRLGRQRLDQPFRGRHVRQRRRHQQGHGAPRLQGRLARHGRHHGQRDPVLFRPHPRHGAADPGRQGEGDRDQR
jgi:hypothetical protein